MVTGGEVLEMRRKVKYFSFLLHLGPTAEKKKELHLSVCSYPNISVMHCFPN